MLSWCTVEIYESGHVLLRQCISSNTPVIVQNRLSAQKSSDWGNTGLYCLFVNNVIKLHHSYMYHHDNANNWHTFLMMIFFFVSVNYWILSFYLFNVLLDSKVWIKALMCAVHLLSDISHRLTSVIKITGWLWVNRMMSHHTWWVISPEEAVVA